jgi:hypothetical protein
MTARPKRALAQRVVAELGGRCQACQQNVVVAEDVYCLDEACNGPGRVYALCPGCRAGLTGKAIRPASERIGALTAARGPKMGPSVATAGVHAARTYEGDRENASRAEREKWGSWTHLTRRIQERVLPGATQQEVEAIVQTIEGLLQRRLPDRVQLDERGTVLIDAGLYGALLLGVTETGGLTWNTWLPPNEGKLPYKQRLRRDGWATGISADVQALLNTIMPELQRRITNGF